MGMLHAEHVLSIYYHAAGLPTADLESRIHEILNTTVSLMAKEYSAGAPYEELAAGLDVRLGRQGAFELSSDVFAEVLLHYSSSLIDQMGKSGQCIALMHLLRICHC